MDIEPNKSFETKNLFISYTSILFMFLLVLYSYQWNINVSSIGFLLVFTSVAAQQILLLRKNRNLLYQLAILAYQDHLTGLKNRRSFEIESKSILTLPLKDKAGFLLIDLDDFKLVNDTLGHLVGDAVLMVAAKRLKLVLQGKNSIYRIGGDEFIIFLHNTSEEHSADVASTILKAFLPPIWTNGQKVTLTTSIGISLFSDHGSTTEELLRTADIAMYQSKKTGKNTFSFYNANLDKIIDNTN